MQEKKVEKSKKKFKNKKLYSFFSKEQRWKERIIVFSSSKKNPPKLQISSRAQHKAQVAWFIKS